MCLSIFCCSNIGKKILWRHYWAACPSLGFWGKQGFSICSTHLPVTFRQHTGMKETRSGAWISNSQLAKAYIHRSSSQSPFSKHEVKPNPPILLKKLPSDLVSIKHSQTCYSFFPKLNLYEVKAPFHNT